MAATSVYGIGATVTLTAKFTVGGVPTNPTAVTVAVRKPDGTTLTPTATSSVVGTWNATVVPDQAGDWYYRFVGTGAAAAVQEGIFAVSEELVLTGGLKPYALADVSFVEAYIDQYDADRRLLERLINAVSLAIRNEVRRQFAPAETAVTHTFSYEGDGYLSFEPYELRTLTTATYHLFGGTATPTAYDPALDVALEPRQGTAEGTYTWLRLVAHLPRYRGGYDVAVTGDWGMASVPEDIAVACAMGVDNIYRNPEGGASRTEGELGITEAPAYGGFLRFLPPAAMDIVEQYRRTSSP